MKTEYITILVNAGVSLLTVIISRLSAKSAARAEAKRAIEKQMAQWNREDLKESRKAFAEMTQIVTTYCNGAAHTYQAEAIKAIAFFGTLVSDQAVLITLSDLNLSIQNQDKTQARQLLLRLQKETHQLWQAQKQQDAKHHTKKNK